ncbi:MAG: DNA mismatch repair protein MutH, partial [Enterobacterales bacterium]|nr:DNA mismatch repair protein MutH [Enterobacterales bacterium]
MTTPQLPTTTPENVQQLLNRAQSLAGYTLGELAARANIAIPRDLK